MSFQTLKTLLDGLPSTLIKSRSRSLLTICVISLILFSVLIPIPASAFFFDDETEEDESPGWAPPERTSGMDLSDEDYIDLWGEISLYDTDSDAYSKMHNTLAPRTGDAGNIQMRELADDLTPNPTPRDHIVEWNSKNLQYNVLDESRKDVIPNDDIVTGSRLVSLYMEPISIDPHTYYHKPFTDIDNYRNADGNTEQSTIKYIPPEVTMSVVSYHDISGTSNRYSGYGLGAERWLYSITDTNVEGSVTAVKSSGGDGTTVDTQSISGDSTKVDLDLSELDQGDEVTFIAQREVSATERERYYVRECVDWDSYTDDEGETHTYCDDSEWIHHGTDYHDDSVEVTHEESARIYKPDVNITYSSAETRSGDVYYLDIKNSQPIAGIAPTGKTDVRYPVKMFGFSNSEYRNILGDFSPVEHHTLPSGNRVTADRAGLTDIHSARGDVKYYRPPKNVNVDIDGTTVREIEHTRLSGTTDNFDPDNIEVTPILPTDSVDIHTQQGTRAVEEGPNLNIISPEIKSTYSIDSELEDQGGKRYSLRFNLLDPATGNPITTEGNSNLHLEIEHLQTNTEQTINTNTNGVANVSLTAHHGDQIAVDLVVDDQDTNPVYRETTDQFVIQNEINAASSVLNLSTGIIVFFFKLVLGPLVALSLITKGLTGDWHPF